MSAWIVSKRHIDAIVTAVVKAGLAGNRTPDQLGDMLWRENVRSVSYRYREREPDVVYRFEPHALNDLWSLVKQLDCYDYQSCEHPEWEASEAYRLTEALREHTLAALGVLADRYQERSEWDAAPWGLD